MLKATRACQHRGFARCNDEIKTKDYGERPPKDLPTDKLLFLLLTPFSNFGKPHQGQEKVGRSCPSNESLDLAKVINQQQRNQTDSHFKISIWFMDDCPA